MHLYGGMIWSHYSTDNGAFILYGKGVEMLDFQIPRVYFSDHLPLVCDFKIKGRAIAAA
jgi:hypothetical protein